MPRFGLFTSAGGDAAVEEAIWYVLQHVPRPVP